MKLTAYMKLLTSLEITHFFLHKTDARPPTKICILTFTSPRLKKIIFRLNNYTSKLAYVLLIDPIKGWRVFY